MNRPWMPLYIADYLADTAHLNAAQSGGYLHLIMHYWQSGSLPEDEQALARIAKMTPSEWKRARSILNAFFYDGWCHKRIDAEIAHAEQVSGKRRAAAEQMHSKRDANGHAIAKAIAPANAEQLNTHARTSAGGLQSPSLSKKQDAPNGALAGGSDPPPSDPDAYLFWRGRKVLGKDAGGLIAELKRSQNGNIAKAQSILELASTKDKPRQYIGGVINQKMDEKPYDPIF